MAFNNFPYTNFQDLNLGWILQTYKEALTKAVEAFAKAVTVENTVGGYTEQINTANANANEALRIARNANEVLFISSDPENKAVNYVNYSQGETVYVTAQDIFSAITADHKVPIFMDNMLYVYELAGYETNPEQPLMVTRFKFTKESENSTDIAWIDRNGSITYTRIDGGANGFPVVFNYIPQNPELPGRGSWESDKTYAEILAAINNGKSIFLTVKIDGEIREIINNAYINKSSSSTYIVLGYGKGFNTYDSPYYTNTDNALVYYTIAPDNYVSVGRVFTVPASSVQITDRVLTVNSSGKAEWLPASGGTSGAVLYDKEQDLTFAEKLQARNNIDASQIIEKVNLSGTSGTITLPVSSYNVLPTALTGAITIALGAAGNQNGIHVYRLRFTTGSDFASCTVNLPQDVIVPEGFYALSNMYLLPDTTYELTFYDNYLRFNYWG